MNKRKQQRKTNDIGRLRAQERAAEEMVAERKRVQRNEARNLALLSGQVPTPSKQLRDVVERIKAGMPMTLIQTRKLVWALNRAFKIGRSIDRAERQMGLDTKYLNRPLKDYQAGEQLFKKLGL